MKGIITISLYSLKNWTRKMLLLFHRVIEVLIRKKFHLILIYTKLWTSTILILAICHSVNNFPNERVSKNSEVRFMTWTALISRDFQKSKTQYDYFLAYLKWMSNSEMVTSKVMGICKVALLIAIKCLSLYFLAGTSLSEDWLDNIYL